MASLITFYLVGCQVDWQSAIIYFLVSDMVGSPVDSVIIS